MRKGRTYEGKGKAHNICCVTQELRKLGSSRRG